MMNDYSTEAMLQQLAADNPKMQMLMEMMQQQKQQQETQQSTQQKSLLVALKREKQERLKALKKIQVLLEEIQEADEFLGELATALGACPNCWGTATDCPTCHGKGEVGFFPPERDFFMELIYPVIQYTPWIRQLIIQQPSTVISN